MRFESNNLVFALTLLCALGSGLIAGVFFAFSSFVMKSLARLPAPQGLAAMQSINVMALTPAFMTALFGTAVACLLLGGIALSNLEKPASIYLVTGSLLYLAGTIGVTIVFNVPRNNSLAAAPASADSANLWASYLTSWTAWNHVRTMAALAAAASFTFALTKDLS